jgi:hypothetical protein
LGLPARDEKSTTRNHLMPKFLKTPRLIALLAVLSLPMLTQYAKAHVAPCPYCDVDLAQDTAGQDNETVLKTGRKRIEYRCVYCALMEAKTEYKGDLTIFAPSEQKGSPVVLTRIAGQWTSDPPGALFAAQKASHKVLHITYRALTNKAAFDAWVKKYNGYFDANAKPLTLAQMNALAS